MCECDKSEQSRARAGGGGHADSHELSFACFLLSNLQDLSEGEANGLSPGFCYLEHVCQMLEEFAEQQRHNQALQRQKTGLQTRPAGEASAGSCLSAFQPFDSCQTDSGAAATSAQRQESKREERSTGERRRPRNLHGHFRQRSASDANVSTLHLSESQPTRLLCFHIRCGEFGRQTFGVSWFLMTLLKGRGGPSEETVRGGHQTQGRRPSMGAGRKAAFAEKSCRFLNNVKLVNDCKQVCSTAAKNRLFI